MKKEEFDEMPDTLTLREIRAGKKVLITSLFCPKKFNVRCMKLYKWALAIIMAVGGFVSCSDQEHFNQHLNELKLDHVSFKPIAEMLLKERYDAIIDFSESPPKIKPLSLKKSLSEKQLLRLIQSHIQSVKYDSAFEGVLFEKIGPSLSVSGSAAGYIFFENQHSTQTLQVSNIQQLINEDSGDFISSNSSRRWVQVVDSEWGLYLEVF